MIQLSRTAALIAALGFVGTVSAQDVMLRATLSGGNVVSVTDSPATGEVAAILSENDNLQIDMVYAGLQLGATGAALHTGLVNANGPAVAKIGIDIGETEGRVAGAQLSLTPTIAASVRAGESYVVITTIEHPDGAIRGQLVPQPARLSDVPAAPVSTPAPAVTVPPAPTPEVPAPEVSPPAETDD